MYSTLEGHGFLDRLALKKWLEMLQIFHSCLPEDSYNNLLDVGVTADAGLSSSNFIEEYSVNRGKITALPKLHWLPQKLYGSILKRMGYEYFSHKEHLNLLPKKLLKKMLNELSLNDHHISHVKLFYWPSNILILINKEPS